MSHVRDSGTLPVPQRFKNAPTKLMQDLGHGDSYRYAHDEPGAYAAGESYFPDGLSAMQYYDPAEQGLEIRIREKLRKLRAMDEQVK